MRLTRSLLLPILFSSIGIASASEPARPVIVQLTEGLLRTDGDMGDARLASRAGFGNLPSGVLGHIQRLERAHGFKAKHGFSRVARGFSANLTPSQISQLRANPAVRLVEPDVEMYAAAQTLPWGISTSGATTSPAALAGDGLQNGVRFDQVRAFVADSGVALHPDLVVGPQVNYVGDGIAGDCNGHGTHVAGTLGALDNADGVVGMAPGIQILPLKVLDCASKGSASNLIKALDYAAATAAANPGIKYVFNASISFPAGTVLTTLDTAIRNAVAAGVFVTVAMGNDGAGTCSNVMVNLSQGYGAAGVVAVASIDSANQEPYSSNFGPCVGIWAPGVSVYSTSSTLGIASMNGTSMAAPHVAGAAALIRATEPALTPVEVDARLKALAAVPGTLSKDGRAIVALNVAGVAPRLLSVATVSPAVLDFGTVKFGKGAVLRTATVRNDGNQVMNLSGFSALPPGVSLSRHDCTNVLPTATCSASFALTANRKGAFSAVASTVGASSEGRFTVQGTVR